MWLQREEYLRQQLFDMEFAQVKQHCINKLRSLVPNVLAWTTTLSAESKRSELALQNSNVGGNSNAAPKRLIGAEFATAVFALRFSIEATATEVWRSTQPEYIGREPLYLGKTFSLLSF
jgi:hypothetical protein